MASHPISVPFVSPAVPALPTVGAARYRSAPRRDLPRWASLTTIAAAHVAVLFGLLQIDAVREQVAEVAPIFVRFIAPPQALPTAPVPPPPRATTPEPPKRRMIASEKPSPPPMQAPPRVDDAPSAPAPAAVAPPAEAVAAAPAPASIALPPVQAPRFTGAGLDNPQAEYPLMSRRLKETGRVSLRVLVGVDGRPDQVELDRSSGFARLDDSALDAVRRWHFIPAKQGDRTVAQWVNVSIPFELTRS